jgi:hypothetical protein
MMLLLAGLVGEVALLTERCNEADNDDAADDDEVDDDADDADGASRQEQ